MSNQIKEKKSSSPFSDEEQTPALPAIEAPAKPVNTTPVLYKRVKFHTKSDKHQPNDVILSLNGLTLLIQRDREIVLPDYFLRVADEATYDQFKPGSGSRQIIAKVRLYPYDILGPATKEEYESARADGAKKYAEARTRDEALQIIR
jgi:hypothetical protein